MSYDYMRDWDTCQQQAESEKERYANILAAIKECIEKGVSKASMATLRFETGIDPRDYIAIQACVIAKLKSEIGELDV